MLRTYFPSSDEHSYVATEARSSDQAEGLAHASAQQRSQ